jgi:hypothetical protein
MAGMTVIYNIKRPHDQERNAQGVHRLWAAVSISRWIILTSALVWRDTSLHVAVVAFYDSIAPDLSRERCSISDVEQHDTAQKWRYRFVQLD